MTARRTTVLLALLGALLLPAAAAADGDPASDVLLFQDAYLPYFPAPAKAESQTLTRLLAQVRRDGYPMKVALIQSAGDLGAYPDLLGRPADYARLLASELAIRVKRPHLLIVMADGGLAGLNLGAAGERALEGIEIDTAAESDGLVRAALEAVAAVASANGHETAVPPIEENAKPEAEGGGKSHLALYVIAGTIAALGLALILVSLRIRSARPRPG